MTFHEWCARVVAKQQGFSAMPNMQHDPDNRSELCRAGVESWKVGRQWTPRDAGALQPRCWLWIKETCVTSYLQQQVVTT